jgi:hypothetical protein
MDNQLIDLLAWAIGAIIVVTFSWNFYNQESYYLDHSENSGDTTASSINFLAPVLPRYASSRMVYFGWFVAFLIFTLSLYVLAAVFLFKPDLGIEQKYIDEISRQFGLTTILLVAYKQLLAAFIVTGLNNVVPRRIDVLTHLRRMAHRQAKIPEEARAVYKRISSADLRLSETQKQKAIDYIGTEYLRVDDFAARPGAIERNWGIICHLLAETASLTRDLGGQYSTNLHNPKLQFDSIRENLETLKVEIQNRRKLQAAGNDQLLSERISQFLKQVTHMVVCLVFLSEPSRKDVFARWHKIGVSLRIRPKFRINASSMFTTIISFSVGVALVAFILGMVLGKPAKGDEVNADYAFNTAVGTFLVVCLPMLLPMVIKWLFSDYWPVRGQFTNERKPALYLFFFIAGALAGVFGLYVTSFLGFMNEEWTHYRPYALLSGGAALLMAFCLDRHPKIIRQKDMLLRAVMSLLFGAVMFLVLGVIAKVWSEEIAARSLELSELLRSEKFLFFLLTAIGAMVGFICSYLADLCLKIKSEQEEIGLNLSEYFLPVVGFHEFEEMDKQQIDKLIQSNITQLPDDFVRYLEDKGVLSNEKLTDNGYDIIAAPHLV